MLRGNGDPHRGGVWPGGRAAGGGSTRDERNWSWIRPVRRAAAVQPHRPVGPSRREGRRGVAEFHGRGCHALLTVSASTAPTLPAPNGAVQAYSQYSLSLRPAEVPSAAGPPRASAVPAVEDTAGFMDRNFKVTPVRDYDPIPDETTFSWQLTGDGPAEYVLVRGCRDASLAFAAGPAGPPAQSQPVADPATGVTGLKWPSGALGTCTVGYKGGVAAAELVVKNGAGSRRVRAGRLPCA